MSVRRAALLLLLVGFVIIVLGFIFLYVPTGEFSLRALVGDFYANAGSELLSIALTVLVIEGLNERRAIQERKEELITQLGGDEPMLTKEAARILRLKGWLTDGSLQQVNLWHANLQGADLAQSDFSDANMEGANLQGVYLVESTLPRLQAMGANLKYASLGSSNLAGARLMEANLEGVVLAEANVSGADLRKAIISGADLRKANLQGAYLWESNLRGSDLQGANLDGAVLGKATLPDGSKWTKETDMRRFTNPDAPNFWSPRRDSITST